MNWLIFILLNQMNTNVKIIEVVEKAKTKLLSEYPNTHFDL